MAQFVTHIQPTLVESSYHHVPYHHHHKDHHKELHKELHKEHIKEHHKEHHKERNKEYYEKHHKEGADQQEGSKDHHGKEKHVGKMHLPKIGHSPQHYPVLPATPSHHHDEHAEHDHKRDSGQYLDSHGIPHTYQLHFIDSQGIYRDFHGHVDETFEQEHHEHHLEKEHHKDYQREKEHPSEKKEYYYENEEVYVRKAVPEDRSPFEKSPSKEDKRPVPPQFINLHSVHGSENKHQTLSSGSKIPDQGNGADGTFPKDRRPFGRSLMAS